MDARCGSVTIRHAFPDDELALIRLAALDSAEVPSQPMLVAELDGELLVALSLRDGAVIADPFHPTRPLVGLLLARGKQLSSADARPGRARGGALTRWILAARGGLS
jgi:hypothetical protein